MDNEIGKLKTAVDKIEKGQNEILNFIKEHYDDYAEYEAW